MQNTSEKKKKRKKLIFEILLGFIGLGVIVLSALLIWAATVRLPDFKSFENRKIVGSTKIYDRTGQTLLFDLHQDVKRTMVPFEELGDNVKVATIAIEDNNFYTHAGIQPRSIVRAVLVDIFHGKSQGGSTITQQIVKNILLTNEKTLTRKLKEWILAIKIDHEMSKDDILSVYLNENPYGGNIYGVYEASHTFFGKDPRDLDLAEASYIAAIPKAPTYYSPYGKNKAKLDERKNVVLARMKELKIITDTQYQAAKNEMVVFQPQVSSNGIKAPHFVFFIKDYLEQKYGQDAVDTMGLKVTTTLDYDLQKSAEDIAKNQALTNEKDFNGSNAALVAIDPKTGQILSMVGSRSYFDKGIDGNFNVATAYRQPGSSFKPFIYATAFNQGYTPDSVLFDVPTEFSTTCSAYGSPLPGHTKSECYSPKDYDGKTRGPMSLRDALAQSINIPAVKLLYLTGIDNSIQTAKILGISSLDAGKARYGLTLVIGGGETSLLDMTSAYSVFANEGVRNPYTGILKVEDASGKVLEEYTPNGNQVLPKNSALMLSDILSDNAARVPTFGANSPLVVSGHPVAVKTGTTNDNKDAWTMGYTPSLAVGVWVGNNDNKPMKKGGAALAGPIWHDFIAQALAKYPTEQFEKPVPVIANKSVLNGIWQGGDSFWIDKISGKLATASTPEETKEERAITNVHDILYWVNKSDPTGPAPTNPYNDLQFNHWEIPVQNWWAANSYKYPATYAKPTDYDDVHTPALAPHITITSPNSTTSYPKDQPVTVSFTNSGAYPLSKIDIFIDDSYISTLPSPFLYTFTPSQVGAVEGANTLRIIAHDSIYNTSETAVSFNVI